MARPIPRATARISAAASTEAKGRVVADSPWTDNVRPISPATLHRIVDIRPTRHVVIAPPLDWRRIANALILAVAVGAAVYFAGQLLRVVL